VPQPTVPPRAPLPCSIDTILKRWAEHAARMGGARGSHKVLVGKPERNRLLGRTRLQ
jgi:hypothetical protein